jgi:hypothetical protein
LGRTCTGWIAPAFGWRTYSITWSTRASRRGVAVLTLDNPTLNLTTLVAPQKGFDGWQALKAGAQAMTVQDEQTISRAVLSSTAAQLFVTDIKTSCNFFITKLGFSIDFLYGDPPYYGQVRRDNARLALRLVCEPVFVADIRGREHLLSASITVDTMTSG